MYIIDSSIISKMADDEQQLEMKEMLSTIYFMPIEMFQGLWWYGHCRLEIK